MSRLKKWGGLEGVGAFRLSVAVGGPFSLADTNSAARAESPACTSHHRTVCDTDLSDGHF